jgi:hypothetical protein
MIEVFKTHDDPTPRWGYNAPGGRCGVGFASEHDAWQAAQVAADEDRLTPSPGEPETVTDAPGPDPRAGLLVAVLGGIVFWTALLAGAWLAWVVTTGGGQ